ncbi:MAG TPA: DsbA family protein [Dongiaceae bacterium]|nr:DsbA family protein [Dongiaceae bacterium]
MNKKFLIALAVLVIVVVGGLAAWQFWPGQPAVTQTVDTSKLSAMPDVHPDDIIIGDEKAPITIIEYYSLSCPHCAHFAEDIFPQVKAAYVDTGKVRFVMRDYPLNKQALQAALLAHCLPKEAFLTITDVLFKSQASWLVEDATQPLAAVAKTAGIDDQKFAQCLSDKAAQDKIIASRKEAEEKYQIDATPTFLIMDQKISGAREFEVMKQLIDAELQKIK